MVAPRHADTESWIPNSQDVIEELLTPTVIGHYKHSYLGGSYECDYEPISVTSEGQKNIHSIQRDLNGDHFTSELQCATKSCQEKVKTRSCQLQLV